jgi:hypothetical protein
MMISTDTSAEHAAIVAVIDPALERLLGEAINSPLKLYLVLLFHANPGLHGNARQISARIFRDIWSTQAALRELACSGILSPNDDGRDPVYRYSPRIEDRLVIARLVERFDDPFMRDRIHAELRDLAGNSYAHPMAEAATCPCCCG